MSKYHIAVPVATFIMAVLCGTDKPRCDVFSNMLLVSVGVVVSSYGEIHFNVVGTLYQVTGIFAEALRLVLTQVLLQKKGLTLNPITSLYYIAPCRYHILTLTFICIELLRVPLLHTLLRRTTYEVTLQSYNIHCILDIRYWPRLTLVGNGEEHRKWKFILLAFIGYSWVY